MESYPTYYDPRWRNEMKKSSKLFLNKIRRIVIKEKEPPISLPLVNTTHSVPSELLESSKSFERANYLLKYDSHYPEWLLCFQCGTFHRREAPRKRRAPLIYRNAKNPREPHKLRRKVFDLTYNCCEANKAFTQTFSNNHIRYRWPSYQEVMRGLRYGSQHGSPYLFNETRSLRRWEYDNHALAVDDRLLLRKRTSVALYFHYKGRYKFFRRKRICPHMRESVHSQHFNREVNAAVEKLEELERNGDSAHLQGFVHKTHRCTSCPTEVRIEVIPRSLFTGRVNSHMRKVAFILTIAIYVDFGACKEPTELEWRSLSTFYKRPQDNWNSLPRCALDEPENVPEEDWPRIDLTYMEPISARFERHFAMRRQLQVTHEMCLDSPPPYEDI